LQLAYNKILRMFAITLFFQVHKKKYDLVCGNHYFWFGKIRVVL